jgi:hypothetical protein
VIAAAGEGWAATAAAAEPRDETLLALAATLLPQLDSQRDVDRAARSGDNRAS